MAEEDVICTPADEQRLWDACCRAADREGGNCTGASLYQRVYRQVGNRKLSVGAVNRRIALLLAGSVQRAVHCDGEATGTQSYDQGTSTANPSAPDSVTADASRVQCRQREDTEALKRQLADIYGTSPQETRNATLLGYLREQRKPGGARGLSRPQDDEVLESDRHQLFKLCAQKVSH